ncbi:MAG TPA: AbrB/MazE/SpoVT family DNA-binding domain-containing protein [Thermoanaerobaculia bacterium]|nr:AbrB/MazE/SpoVT family DNA-binding domain-containing protein [Thermoanaerobaculia bacterium]
MKKKLTRTGNSLALVLDKPLLEALGVDENTEVEVSTNGDVLVMTPVRDRGREKKLRKILDELDKEYGGVFKRLADS